MDAQMDLQTRSGLIQFGLALVIFIYAYFYVKKRKKQNALLTDKRDHLRDIFYSKGFEMTSVFEGSLSCRFFLGFDDNNKQIIYLSGETEELLVVPYSDLVSSSIITRENGTISRKKQGTGRSLLIAALGDYPSLSMAPTETKKVIESILVRIVIKNNRMPAINVVCWATSCTSDSDVFKQQYALAEDIQDRLLPIINENMPQAAGSSIVDQLNQLTQLKTQGALSEDEYELAKQRILRSNQ